MSLASACDMETADRALAYKIFSTALDLRGRARERYIREQCGEHTALYREVTDLMAIADRNPELTGNQLLAQPPPSPQNLVGQEYGHFRLVELIGAGGVGVVYRAERIDGLPQSVAIKLLRGEFDDSDRQRFFGEARLLARLEHPAIARLIDVGVKNGEGWIALELVRGVPIDEYCDRHQLGIRARVRLLAILADAVATAHRMLVVHRDIKPTNVLVTDEGLPKLIDFGIASALASGESPREPTVDVRKLFTPHYAAPEQVGGDPITVATDVFGLGALGYRLLSGHPPYAQATTAIAYLLAVAQTSVDPPSRVAEAAALGHEWVRALRGDIDAILLKALAQDPRRRYPSAQALQLDLQRYLDGQAVSVRPRTYSNRAARFVRRLARTLNMGTPRRAPRRPDLLDSLQGRAGGKSFAPHAALVTAAILGLVTILLWRTHRPAPVSPAAGHTSTLAPAAAAATPGQIHTAYDDHPSAREQYMNARFELLTRTPDGLQAAERSFRALTQQFPERADAWSGLADCYLLMREFAALPDAQAYPLAERASATALRLNPQLADAWLDEGFIAFWWNENMTEARHAFETALRLDPTSAKGYQWYGNILSTAGKIGLSLQMLARARALDPGNRSIVADEAWARISAGQLPEGLETLERMSRVDPKFAAWHWYLARTYALMGRDADSLREYVATAQLRGQKQLADDYARALDALHRGGRQAMLRARLQDAAAEFARGDLPAFVVAASHALAADRAGTLHWLKISQASHESTITVLADPSFAAYRHDPEFASLWVVLDNHH